MPNMPSTSSLELSTTLSLRSGDQSWGTERRMALLAAIGTEGSISAAARKVGLSYKAAWDAVDLMNSLAGDLLVERVTGGKRGGGAHLTERARELIAWYQAAQAEHQRFMENLTRVGPEGARHLDLLHHMTLQTSARNCYEGTIGAIESGRINDRIRLDLGEGVSLNATLTHASTERLGLAEGRRALAFLKAQAVRIRPQAASAADLNLWTGLIDHRTDDDTLAEISLDINAKVRITGLAAPGAPRGSLLAGTTATACFQAADVLIGTLD
ncbi:MAG: TOBE domain-containing protein [Castellaniella sp.]|uniref:TOBE domain-containing protein n=2 Tax=Castellaniella sp. TaxID=1955812 RepID=UPI003C70A82D